MMHWIGFWAAKAVVEVLITATLFVIVLMVIYFVERRSSKSARERR